MSVTQERDIVPPLAVIGILHSQWAAHALRAAMELDLFTPLKDKPLSAAAVAKGLGATEQGTRLLLDAMVGVSLLSKEGNNYSLTEIARRYLIPGAPLFMGSYINLSGEIYKRWSQLAASIKTGTPIMEVNTDEGAQQFFPELTRGIFPMSYSTAEMTGRALEIERLPAGSRILDIAAGSASWSIPLAKSNGKLKVEALDFPPVLEVAREFVDREGVSGQYSYISGNWRDVSFEKEAYDIIILGHILHSEGEQYSRQLVAKCFDALKPGGRLVIGEFMPNEDRTGPAHPLMFALNMFLCTTEGCVFTARELEKMCRTTGFSQAGRLVLPFYGEESPVVVAAK